MSLIGFVTGAWLCFVAPTDAAGAEVRTWTSLEGRTLRGTLEKVVGDHVMIRLEDGRTVSVPKSRLSPADLQHLGQAGGPAPAQPGAVRRGTPEALPLSAQDAVVDRKAFAKLKDHLYVAESLYDTLQTPHFFISHAGRTEDPEDVAECAESLWQEMAARHPGFSEKWGERRMVILLMEKGAGHEALGKWQRSLLLKANPDSESTRQFIQEHIATWPEVESCPITLDQETAEKYRTHTQAQVYARNASDPQLKGVWTPLRTHSLASSLLEFQAGGVPAGGAFAIFTGFSYYREIALCGKAATSLLSARYSEGSVARTLGGFANSEDWPGELKRILRAGKHVIPPAEKGGDEVEMKLEELVSLERLLTLERRHANAADLALIAALVQFMHSTPGQAAAFAEMIKATAASRKVPDAAEVARLFSHASAAEFQAAWLAWMKSSAYK